MALCHQCGGAVDALRSNARIHAGAIVYVCEGCAGRRRAASEPAITVCSECGDDVPVAEVTAAVRGGQVVQRCADCIAGRKPATDIHYEPDQPSALKRSLPHLALAAVVLAFIAAPTFLEDRAVTLYLDLSAEETARIHRARVAPRDIELQYSRYMEDDPRPVNWHHPLAGDLRLPRSESRRFGALRVRPETRRECGRGHCGVDLGNRDGEVVHAAANGIIDRIVRDEHDPGGRYVRIRHSSGFTTFYMHLGAIHPDLEVGDEIRAGEPVGLVGTSGITYSAPHLHFAIRQIQADGEERFLDPEPFLQDAKVRGTEAPFPRQRDHI